MKKTIIALAVFALLGGYFYFFEFKKKEAEAETKKKAESLIYGVTKDGVTGVEIKNSHETIKLAKREGGWMIEAPIKTHALVFPVEAVINNWLDKTAERIIEGEPPAEYGISPEGYYCSLTMQTGETVRFSFGHNTVVPTHMYAQKSGEPDRVYVIETEIFRTLDRDVKEFRYNGMVKADSEHVYEVQIALADRKYTLLREGALWKVKETGKFAKTERANQIISNYTGRAVREFHSDKKAASFGLSNPKEKVVFRMKGGDKTLYFSSRGKEAEKKYYGLSPDFPGEVLEIEEYVYKYPPEPSEIENKQAVMFTESEIERIEARDGVKSWSAKRTKDSEGNPRWAVYDIKGYDSAERKKINADSALSSLYWAEHRGSFTGVDTAAAAEAYKISGEREFRIYDKNGNPAGHLSIGTVIDGNEEVFFRNEKNNTIYSMEKSLPERMGF